MDSIKLRYRPTSINEKSTVKCLAEKAFNSWKVNWVGDANQRETSVDVEVCNELPEKKYIAAPLKTGFIWVEFNSVSKLKAFNLLFDSNVTDAGELGSHCIVEGILEKALQALAKSFLKVFSGEIEGNPRCSITIYKGENEYFRRNIQRLGCYKIAGYGMTIYVSTGFNDFEQAEYGPKSGLVEIDSAMSNTKVTLDVFTKPISISLNQLSDLVVGQVLLSEVSSSEKMKLVLNNNKFANCVYESHPNKRIFRVLR